MNEVKRARNTSKLTKEKLERSHKAPQSDIVNKKNPGNPDVFHDETPKLKVAKSDPCGKLVYESGVLTNDETGPSGDHKIIKFKILRYELCVKIIILDPGGGGGKINEITLASNPESGVTIHYPNGKTVHVQGYSKVSKGDWVGAMNTDCADFWGKYMCFVVDGCTSPMFVQFIDETSTVGNTTTTTGWIVDGGTKPNQDFKGTLKGKSADGSSSMTDWPGRFEPPVVNLPFGTKVDLLQNFETYVCCDGKLIGYWSWSNHVSYTAKNGKRENLNVDQSTPVWQRNPATGVNGTKVKCPTL